MSTGIEISNIPLYLAASLSATTVPKSQPGTEDVEWVPELEKACTSD